MYKKNRHPRTCANCGLTFVPSPDTKKGIYCSRRCSAQLANRSSGSRFEKQTNFIGPPHIWKPVKSAIWDSPLPPAPVLGEKYYFDGSICSHGHIAPRKSRGVGRTGDCLACGYTNAGARESAQKYVEGKRTPEQKELRVLREIRSLVKEILIETEPTKIEGHRTIYPIAEAMLWEPQGSGSSLFPRGFDFTTLPRNRSGGLTHPSRSYFDGYACSHGHLAPIVFENTGDGGKWICAACRAYKKARNKGRSIILVPPSASILDYVKGLEPCSTPTCPSLSSTA